MPGIDRICVAARLDLAEIGSLGRGGGSSGESSGMGITFAPEKKTSFLEGRVSMVATRGG